MKKFKQFIKNEVDAHKDILLSGEIVGKILRKYGFKDSRYNGADLYMDYSGNVEKVFTALSKVANVDIKPLVEKRNLQNMIVKLLNEVRSYERLYGKNIIVNCSILLSSWWESNDENRRTSPTFSIMLEIENNGLVVFSRYYS